MIFTEISYLDACSVAETKDVIVYYPRTGEAWEFIKYYWPYLDSVGCYHSREYILQILGAKGMNNEYTFLLVSVMDNKA